MGIEDEPQLGGPLDRGPQEALHLRADIALPLTRILKIALPKVVGEQQRVFGRSADDVGRRPDLNLHIIVRI
jgi:hypothetical protein